MSDFETEYRTKHKRLSFLKSGIRIGAGLAGFIFMPYSLTLTVFAFIFLYTAAEFVGIWEEMI